MPRLVSFKIASFFVLSLLLTLPLVSSAENLKIINVYSLGDKAAFLVVNTSNNQLMELVYENGRFTRVYPLNFSLETYIPVHWNGEYWLLQKGLGPVVGLYIYNGSLKHVATFVNGTICAYNDLRIQWNGEEYLLTFLKSSPKDNPATGDCYYPTSTYLLLKDKLIPLNVSGTMTWVPPVKKWIVWGEKIALLNEIGAPVFLDIPTPHRNATMLRVYDGGVAYSDGKIWLLLTWGWDYENISHVKVYRLEEDTVRRVYSGEFPGEVHPFAMTWNGTSLLVQYVTLPKYTGLNTTVLLFNGTGFSRVGTFNDCSELTPVSVDGRVFILCMMAGGDRRVTIMKLFAIKGGKKELVRSFTTSGYPYRYGVKDFLGFPAFKENNHSSLILYTSDELMLFNSTHAMNLLTGERTPLPPGLKGRGYNVTYCSGEWVLFTRNEAYTLKNGKFAELKLAIPSTGETTNGTTGSPLSTQTSGENITPSPHGVSLVPIIAGAATALLLLVLYLRRR